MWVHDSFEEYLSTDAISSSGLVTLYTHTPAHYRERSNKSTKQTTWGTTIHEFITNGSGNFMPNPFSDKRTKEYKDLKSNNPDRILVNHDEYAALVKIKKNILANERASQILQMGVEYETSGYTEGRRIRPDARKHGTIYDLKTTTRGIERDDFLKHVFGQYYYCVQAAWYVDTARKIDGKYYEFLWVIVEQEAPYSVKTFKASDETLDVGRQIYKQSLEIYKACKAADEWPSYHDSNETIEVPEWFKLKTY